MNKKGQAIPLLILLGLIIILIVVSPISAYFLSKNIFVLLGGFLVVMGVVGVLKGFNPSIALSFLGIGLFLVFAPALFKNLAGITLASVLP